MPFAWPGAALHDYEHGNPKDHGSRAISTVGQDFDPDPQRNGQDRNPDLRRCHPTLGADEVQLAVRPRLATITADNREVRVKIILANPRGFCAGVNMAIESLERALELFGTPLYV